MQHINLFRNLETVVRELDARGHETIVLHGTRLDSAKMRDRLASKKQKMVFMGRGIEVADAEISSLTTGYRPEPAEPRQQKLKLGRQVMNRSIYLRKGHPSPERVVEGLEKSLPERVKKTMESRMVRAVLRRPFALRAWRRIERGGAASETVTALIEEIAPDVVLVSPTVWPKNPVEADYVHAARTLGIPTIGYLNSWDNLTSKGTVHVLPDVFIVWNEALASEAEKIHLIPRKVIRVTGAPHLDHFFELQPSRPRAVICRALGCPDDGPYVVYLCSSRTLIADETHIVTRLADALARELPGGAPTIVVRPHPVNPEPWEGYDHPGTAVYPNHGDQADTPKSWQEYFDQLSGASAFVGLNTTAFLEAAVADRPCLTIVSEEFFDQQGRTGHFRHLLAADFLEVSSDVEEVATRVARVLGGADEKAAGRRRFAREFLRPRGIARSARSVVADTIEELAAPRRTPAGRRTPAPPQQPALSVSAGKDDS
ncbi:MAG TPA: hypothetical protein VMY78_14425 [Solirubrobacteraceae bacterium]|nr:hypothetical protein [Solirubrobacteraceae bacterium]